MTDRMPSSEDTLSLLLNPTSVAIIGASDDPTRIGGRPLRYMREAGFKGQIYAVNAKRDSVQGLPAFRCVAELPGPVDTAIIAVPAHSVVEVTKACADANVKSAVIFSSGFAETSDEGRRRQDQLSEIARTARMRIVGPNCLGIYNSVVGFFATFSSTIEGMRPTPGRVGLVSQSGAYGSHLSLLATLRGIGIRFWITTGNECDLDVSETLGWMAKHPDISVIVACAEGVRDGDRLLASLALAHERHKPVIFQKMGRSKVGADAVQSHTASLAGTDAVYEGVFRQYGVYRARSTEEMLDVTYAATFDTLPTNRRIGLMSISGGVGVQMADEAVELGLEVTPMSDGAQARLKALLPYASPRNPVDITAQAFNNLDLVKANLDVMLEGGIYGAIVAFFTFVAAAEAIVEPIQKILRDAKKRHPDCLLILSIVGSPEVIQRYEDAGFPVFEDPIRAIRAVDALSRFRERFMDRAPLPPIEIALTPLPPVPISEYRAKQILAQAGLPFNKEYLASTATEAVSAATEIGFPVAVKVASPNIQHKTEISGFELGLTGPDDVRRAFIAVTSRARRTHADAYIEGVLVSRMVTGGIETILGAHHDPTFGQVVMFGLGGIFVETIEDVSFRVAPFGDDEAHRMMRELKGFPLLDGTRGGPRCDLDRLAAVISSLSRFAATHAGSLQSTELNPLVVLPTEHDLVALDALIVTRQEPVPPEK